MAKTGAHMETGTHRVVFKGEVLPGTEPGAVRKNLAARLGLSEKSLDRLFSGQTVVVKEDLDKKKAMAYVRAFRRAGAVCRVEQEPGSPAALPARKPPESATQGPAACPRCGFAPVTPLECPRCGIVFSKFQNKAGRLVQTEPAASFQTGAAAPSDPIFTPRTRKALILILFLAMAGIFSGWRFLATRPITHGPGILVPDPPVQVNLTGGKMFNHNGVYITPLAEFSLQARVLSAKHYWFDKESDIVPWDMAMGWGPMSDEAVLSRIDISQSGRFYYWSTTDAPIPLRSIERHSANMHLIPANKTLKRRMGKVRIGNLVKLSGYLVQIYTKEGWRMKSSLTRDDTGAGACEVIYVKDFEIL